LSLNSSLGETFEVKEKKKKQESPKLKKKKKKKNQKIDAKLFFFVFLN